MSIRRTFTASIVALTALVAVAHPATGAPLDDKVAEATRLNQQIMENGLKITALAEQYNGAKIRLDQANRDLLSAQANFNAAQANADALRSAVDGRATQLMKQNAAGKIKAAQEVDLTEVESAAQRAKYAQISGDLDREAMNRLVYVLEDLDAKRQVLEKVQATRKAEAETIQKSKDELTKINEEQSRTLSSISAEIRALMTEELARSQGSLVAAFKNGNGLVKDAVPDAQPPNLKVQIAIAFAQSQLGKPYVYASAGPETWDCSGLTKKAYEAAGISMLHYSGYQYRDFPRVPLDQLYPGDLVFWGENASQHVGLYIGGGFMIHAPQTGDVVKIAPVFSGVMGASRPWL